MTDGETGATQVGDVFVIGNGTSKTTLSNAFRVTYAGEKYMVLKHFNLRELIMLNLFMNGRTAIQIMKIELDIS